MFLDDLVKKRKVEAVLTIFGPSRWRPKVKHLCGFAMPALVIPESPFFSQMNMTHKVKWWLWSKIRQWSFQHCANNFWTENPYISKRLEKLLSGKNVYTVSNYYNQIFDNPDKWIRDHDLPSFNGITCLSVSSPIDHKNFKIIPEIIHLYKKKWPAQNIRFVLTFTYETSEMDVPNDVKDNILFVGKVDVSEVPYLYEQSDIMFMPSLLECFSATYPEAMRMGKPIVTTDLEFAHGLCGDAACYFDSIDAESAADAIHKVATDKEYANQLVASGKQRLNEFDNYEERANKLISIVEHI